MKPSLTVRIALVLTLLLAQVGCATSEADLDYTREKASDKQGDSSYHGWNSANH